MMVLAVPDELFSAACSAVDVTWHESFEHVPLRIMTFF